MNVRHARYPYACGGGDDDEVWWVVGGIHGTAGGCNKLSNGFFHVEPCEAIEVDLVDAFNDGATGPTSSCLLLLLFLLLE